MYLRHSSWFIRLDTDDGSALFKEDATFTMFWTHDGERIKFHSYNFPDYLITPDGTLQIKLVQFTSFEVAY